MRVLLAFILASFSLFLSPLSAHAEPVSEQPAVEESERVQSSSNFSCKVELEFCSFRSVNLPATSLINIVVQTVYKARHPQGENFIYSRGVMEILFWDEDIKVRQQIKEILFREDRFQVFHPRPEVRLKLELYRLTEQALSDFHLSLMSLVTGMSGIPKLSYDSLSSALDLRLGDNQISNLLGSQVAKKRAELTEEIELAVADGTYVTLNDIIEVYRETTSGAAVSKNIGTAFEGRVGIVRVPNEVSHFEDVKGEGESSLTDAVLIQYPRFSYGLPASDPTSEGRPWVKEFNFYNNELVIPNQKSSLVLSVSTLRSMFSSSKQLIGMDREREISKDLFILAIRAQIYTFSDIQRLSSTLEKTELSEKDIEELPRSDLSWSEVFESFSLRDPRYLQGQLLWGFQLDPSVLTYDNYNQPVTVEVSGAGLNFKDHIRLQDLVLRGFLFKPLEAKYLDKDQVSFSVKLKTYSSSEKTERKIKLKYSPRHRFFLSVE